MPNFEELKKQLEEQKRMININKVSLANVIETQKYLELENSKTLATLIDINSSLEVTIRKLECKVLGLVILFIIMLMLCVIQWLI